MDCLRFSWCLEAIAESATHNLDVTRRLTVTEFRHMEHEHEEEHVAHLNTRAVLEAERRAAQERVDD